jgi:hypothetical protein
MSAAIPLIAAGLLALAELVHLMLRREGSPEPSVWRRIASAAGAGAGAAVVAALLLLAATVHVGRSLAMTIAGTVTAVTAIALLSRTSSR